MVEGKQPVDDSKQGTLLSKAVNLINTASGDDAHALTFLAELTPAQMTELVRDASNWAFKLDLAERVEQIRANELGMLEDGTTLSAAGPAT